MSKPIPQEFDPHHQTRNWASLFAGFDSERFSRLLKTKDESYWLALGEKRALRLFHAAAERVPAYKDFLKKNRIKHESIRTIENFASVPPTDKNNYIKAYPLEDHCWDGVLSESALIAMSSGTSGEPSFWPRGGYQEYEADIIHELLYRHLFDIQKYRTLLVIGFPMGVYVSGVATLLPSWLVAQKNYNMTVASVGNNKDQMLKIAEHLQDGYEQVIMVGHPFFIKDIIETGAAKGVRWRDTRLRMLFCSEGFNEAWRDYLTRQTGASGIGAAMNTYGSSETLLIGHETPLTVLARQMLEKNAELREELADTKITPGLFQYNPLFRHIESVKNELLFTCAGGIPLIRFNLHDSGQIISSSRLLQELKAHKIKLPAQPWRLPVVSLNGRSDHTIIFYAANIYPEHIHASLNHKPFLKAVTGKFAMRKDYTKNMDEFLEINIELKPGIRPSQKLAREIQTHAVKTLRRVNMEYLFLCNHLDKDLTPRIVLRPYQDPTYFKPGLKPKYIV